MCKFIKENNFRFVRKESGKGESKKRVGEEKKGKRKNKRNFRVKCEIEEGINRSEKNYEIASLSYITIKVQNIMILFYFYLILILSQNELSIPQY